MTGVFPGVVAVAVSLVTSVLLVRLLLPVLVRRGVLDVPVSRSMHADPVPRGGGLAVVGGALAGVVAAVLVATVTGSPTPVAGLAALVPVVLLAGVGLVDDLRSLGTGVRLLAQVAVGLGVGLVLAAGVPAVAWSWVPIVVLATVLLVNVTNFMDGANGVVSGHAVVAGGWLAVVAVTAGVPGAAVLTLAVAGAAAGFLPANLPVARVFLGDVGSYALGATWAVVGTWLVVEGAPVETVLAPLALLLADAGVTLLRRLAAGDPVTAPHRMHVYQRLVRGGWSHARVAALVVSGTLLCSLVTLPGVLGAAPALRLGSVALVLVVCAAYLALVATVGPAARWVAAREASR
ncbi:UDP-phosphate glycosyltransferase [Phycicoccus sp. BSK3Z-2]|uniref:UDP-phosphate glycosyltransferase n=1 Tax=Phycicoccus avicenniae TaxID=2828860 RepID=A0A941HY60_9MICO|nr:UDP-phosphate glycosyltransferase [Phycicoccus avicenniae]MBR7742598.1 UDP-phosphate glycosyltransferase [Phycicoccus avicenniae]